MCVKAKTFQTPIGKIEIRADEGGVCGLLFHADGEKNDGSEIIAWAQRELEEYFAGRRKIFSVPLSIKGTPFQEKVWKALLSIPYGETRTYGEIAAAIGDKNAARAVGMANNKNPLPVFIPCHRVIGAKGKLTGYAGGLEIKEILLEIEERNRENV